MLLFEGVEVLFESGDHGVFSFSDVMFMAVGASDDVDYVR